jgi:hypothetical protein
MQTVTRLFVVPAALILMSASSLFAAQQEQHIVTPGELSATVAGRVASQDADRAAVHAALQKPQVREVASSMGVDVARVDGLIDTLSGPELEKAGDAARQVSAKVDEQLVGGSTTVIISTTTIVIVLLLIIILVLVA